MWQFPLRESDWMEFWKPQVGRYATPALLTACAGRGAHRIPPGRSPSPRGVRARESEMPARTECGCHRRRAAVASALMRSISCVTCRSKCVGWRKEVGPEGDEQIAVVPLGIRTSAGKQSQRLHHERKPETF